MGASAPLMAESPAQWDADLLQALYELVFSSPDREAAGVLVGVPLDDLAALPVVRAAIPATQGFTPGQASLFTHNTWAQVHTMMAKHYRGLHTVGWYVSRPGNGTELTEADVLNHSRWFAHPGQILLVVDSQTHQAALYAWVSGRLTLVTAGPIARRYTRPTRLTFPVAGVGLLVVLGVALGAVSFIFAQALGG
jgi:hypothetical protein